MVLGISNPAEPALEAAGDGVLASAEDQRRHFARELHDQVAQPLIDLVLELDGLRRAAGSTPALANELARIEESARQVLRQAREMLIDLRERDDLRIDLRHALADEVPVPPGHQLALDVKPRWPRRINGWAAFNLMRIVQQAVANAWRHGRATSVDVILDVGANNEAVLVVSDDGIGMDDSPHGFGMVGMQERAQILGGSFSARRREPAGTRVEVRVPVDRIR